MKIVSIKFLNLNSLKGEHEIRFDKPPFTESGLFAITGPTGAGKTTILDAITLAMYGEVHRHEKGDPSEIMTRHTVESYSEVEFEVKGIVYRSKWSNYRAHKKAGGKLQGVKMELANATTNKIIENTKLANFHQKIVEITGLEYNQFLRSVILSQGDFTRFLKANENERSDLLEKITDTEIYSDISIFTFEKTREEKAKLDLLRNKLNNVTLLTAEELEAYNNSISETASLVDVKGDEKKKLENQALWLQNITRLGLKKEELLHELQVFATEYEAQQPSFEKLRLHQNALKHLPLLRETEASERQAADIEKRYDEISLLLPRMENASALVSAKYTEAEKACKTAELLWNETAPVISETEKKDVLIEAKKARSDKEVKDYSKELADVERTKNELLQHERDLIILQENVGKLQQWLFDHAHEEELEKSIPVFEGYLERLEELHLRIDATAKQKLNCRQQTTAEKDKLKTLQKNDQRNQQQISAAGQHLQLLQEQQAAVLENKFLEQWEAEAAALPSLVSVCGQQLSIAKQIQQLSKSLSDFALGEKKLSEQRRSEANTLELLKKQYSAAEELLSAFQKNVELQALIQKYEADRKNLEPNQECPLCGSTDHPYIKHPFTNELNESEKKRNTQRLRVAGLLKQVSSQEVLLKGLERDLDHLQRQEAEARTSHSAFIQTFDANNQQLPAPLDREKPEIIEAVIEKKLNEQAKLTEKISLIRTTGKKITESETGIVKLNEAVLKNEAEIRQTELRITNAEESLHRIQNELNDMAEQQTGITARAEQFLARYTIAFKYENGKSILLKLKSHADTFLSVQKNLQQNQNKLSETENEIKHLHQSIEEKNARLLLLQKQVKESADEITGLLQDRFTLFGEKDTNKERKRLEGNVAERRNEVESIRTDMNKTKQDLEIAKNQQLNWAANLKDLQHAYHAIVLKLNTQLGADNIDSLGDLKQRFLPDIEAEQIEQRRQQSDKQQTELNRSIADNETDLKRETARQLTVETPGVLSERITELEAGISNLNQEIGRIKEILKADEQRKAQFREIAQIIEVQQKEFDRWNQLCLLIGSENGKKFSRFAQGLTLARLTGLANRHLLQLSDRYRILKAPEKDLELQIIDSYQADAVRPMATLSGGESFLVSLALALGLSDLASRKVRIDSLFIDEGFGTLDADTLDVAISALENLQANGKSIGIISHVEALKDRIGTQIQVQKQPGGSSKIKLVSYGSKVMDV